MKELAVQFLKDMLRIRAMEEKCAELYGAGKIRGFLHLYIGEEAIAAGARPALGPEDSVIGTYREHGHALLRGVPMERILAEMYGKVEGCSRGRGGSMHLFHLPKRFYGGYAIVSGGIPIAVGLALADKLQGRSGVSACFFGDGAVAEGEFHESMNLAALWKLPVLFLCENNQYAMGTALERHQAQTDLAAKASAYCMPGWKVDGMDVMAVHQATQEAVARVRKGEGPLFIEFATYRFRAHSMFDPELYRSKEEVKEWRKCDPVPRQERYLREQRWLDDLSLARIRREVDEEVERAVEFAEQGHWEPLEDLDRDVYARGSSI